MNIDWSKAPEGATHARFIREEDGVVLSDFYRMSGDKFECFSEMRGHCWVLAFWGPEQCELRPEPKLEFSPQLADARRCVVDQMVREGIRATGVNVYEGDVRLVSEALYDAGYRKFEIVEEDV